MPSPAIHAAVTLRGLNLTINPIPHAPHRLDVLAPLAEFPAKVRHLHINRTLVGRTHENAPLVRDQPCEQLELARSEFNWFAADITGSISSSDERIRLVLKETIRVAIQHVRNGETVDIGSIRLKPRIPGSMPYEDSPFDPERDEVIVDVYVLGDLLNVFDGIVPTKVSADDIAASIKVSNVMDVATEEFATIYGLTEFLALGNGLTLDGEDEYVKLINKKTGETVATAEVTSVSKGQRAHCVLPALCDSGDYTAEFATHGLLGDEQLHLFRKSVKYVRVEPEGPYLTRKSPITKLKIDGDNLTLFGLNLPNNWNEENYKLLVGSAYTPDEEPSVATFPKSLIRDTSDPTKIELDFAEFVNEEYGIEGREIVPGGVYPFTFQVNMEGALSNVLSFNLIGEA